MVSEELIQRLESLLKAKNFRAVIEHASEIDESVKLPHSLLRIIGYAHLEEKEYRTARGYFERALALENHIGRGLLSIAESYAKAGDVTSAVAYGKKIRTLVGKSRKPSPQDLQAWIESEKILQDGKQISKALTRAVRLYPNDPRFTPRWFSLALNSQGWSKQVTKVAEKFLKKNPHHPEAAACYVRYLLQRGELQKAYGVAMAHKEAPLHAPDLLPHWANALTGWKATAKEGGAELLSMASAIAQKKGKSSPLMFSHLAKAALKHDDRYGTQHTPKTPGKDLALDLYLLSSGSTEMPSKFIADAFRAAILAEEYSVAHYFAKLHKKRFPKSIRNDMFDCDLRLIDGDIEGCFNAISHAAEQSGKENFYLERLAKLHNIVGEHTRSLSVLHAYLSERPFLSTEKRTLLRSYLKNGNYSLLLKTIGKRATNKSSLPQWARELLEDVEKRMHFLQSYRSTPMEKPKGRSDRFFNRFRQADTTAVIFSGLGKIGISETRQSLKKSRPKLKSVKIQDYSSKPVIPKGTKQILLMRQSAELTKDGLLSLMTGCSTGRAVAYSSRYALNRGVERTPFSLLEAEAILCSTEDISILQQESWKSTVQALDTRLSSQFVPGVLQ